MTRIRTLTAIAAIVGASASPPAQADFLLRDGDTVVFLGDSITAARTYGKIVENYTLLRFPGRSVRFVNSGWGGDTAAGGLKRLERDVFAHGATVLIVAYGVNDIGWGLKADDEHKAIYLDAVRSIIERCRERGVRVFLCSAAVTAADPDKSENDFLQRMCDEGMRLARDLGERSIDVQRTMRKIQKRIRTANERLKPGQSPETLHAADGVHLNDLGQLAMAFAILKGLGAPAEVSAVTIDAGGPTVVQADGCRVTGLEAAPDRVEFDRLDEGLPINFGVFGALKFRFIPVPDQLNRYMLTIKGLSDGAYSIEANGRGLGRLTASQLAAGVNLASSTADGWEPGGPWDAQAALLQRLTDARHEAAQARLLAPRYLSGDPKLPAIDARSGTVDLQIVELQRTLAKPGVYHFVVRRADPPQAGPGPASR
jgi:lysophospholipase L1-like esterase